MRCTREASAIVDGVMADGSVEVAWLCADHRVAFLHHWDMLQADAARLRDAGFDDSEVRSLMLERVERDAYETDPTDLELLVRRIEERWVRLHRLIREGKGDDDTADELREVIQDEIDDLPLDVQRRVNDFSGNLYEWAES